MTEIGLANGERLRVEGALDAVSAAVTDAARGSIMELAWVTEVDSGRRVGVNPEHVAVVRSLDD